MPVRLADDPDSNCMGRPGALKLRHFGNHDRSEMLLPVMPKQPEHYIVWSNKMSLGTILLVVLILALLGVVPAWPHSRGWGYYPGGFVGVLLIVVAIMMLTGRV